MLARLRARLRGRPVLPTPAVHEVDFIRACLPANPNGARDLADWLTAVGGPSALAVPGNPFKPSLPALAYAIAMRGEQPPAAMRAVLGFTELVEPMRASHYDRIIDRLSVLMAEAGLSGFLGGDAAAARSAYPGSTVRHIAAIRILAPKRQRAAIEALCGREGFQRRGALAGCVELAAASGARIQLCTGLFPSDRSGTIERLLAGRAGGLIPLPLALLFVSSVIAGYPPVDAAHGPAMVDAAVLAPMLSADDWCGVAALMPQARREPLRAALAYLRDALGVAVPISGS
jgi:hypothetical protein